jgi:Cleft lip and palate transmembrane protein 1 (CLPTM1)
MSESTKKSKKSLISVSCGTSVLMVFYLAMAMLNLYRLMYPLSSLDLSVFPPSSFVGPLWESPSKLFVKVYLSTQAKFTADFVTPSPTAAVLLWDSAIDGSIHKSFLLCSENCDEREPMYQYASNWLDQAERKEEDGILAAGEGIESTSILIVAYNALTQQFTNLLQLLGFLSIDQEVNQKETPPERAFVKVPPAIFSSLHSNSTVYLHVLMTRTKIDGEDTLYALNRASKSNSLLLDKVDLVKYDIPHHIHKPTRILFHDIKYVLGLGTSKVAPWNFQYSQPEEFRIYKSAQEMKKSKAGYPYWKPEVSIKYIYDGTKYPKDYVHVSGMPVVETFRSNAHPTGLAILPSLYVDEIGLTSEKYLPLNQTATALPLRISLDRSDIQDNQRKATATAGSMSPGRWRLLTQLSEGIESQKSLGFEQSDIDDMRRLIADTNITLLFVTLIASGLHLLFEFLTFKNEVSFWRANKDLTGLSVRSLFLDMIGQVVILFFLVEKDSSLLMIIPSACGCLIALWKCQRGAGLLFQKVVPSKSRDVEWYNRFFCLMGFELRATRLEMETGMENSKGDSIDHRKNLRALTIETDKIATRKLGAILLPLVLGYTAYSFLYEKHSGWYSWLITSASSAVYALGFVLMTPQLFLNYKLKSVAHLPWRVLVYKFLNTFIDDLFAFIIRMPTMARISCFRDDIVFIVYLYQRWLYPVDQSRPVEGGDGSSSINEGTSDVSKKSKTE